MPSHDVVVLGGGPAGLSLASAVGEAGLSVATVDLAPDAAWPQRFGAWSDELGDDLAPLEAESWAAPTVYTRGRGGRLLDRRYVALDTPRVQSWLVDRAEAAGVTRVAGRALAVAHDRSGSTVTLDTGTTTGRLVVDATGTGAFVDRPPRGPVAHQVAWGELLEVRRHPFDRGEMVFMDLRPVDGSPHPPTFLYAQPLGRDRLFVEETSLIGGEIPRAVLQQRLSRRLEGMGVTVTRRLDVEACRIPMTLPLPDRNQRTLAFGVSASMVHPATGYQLVRTLGRAPAVATCLADALGRDGTDLDAVAHRVWRSIWPRADVRCWELYDFGARFLATLDVDRTERFFDAFFDLPTQEWSGFLSATQGPGGLARVMAQVFARLGVDLRWQLVRAGVGRTGAPLLRAALAL